MVQAIEVFKTTDGEVFDDRAKAEQHQAGIDNKVKIDEFIDRHFPANEPEEVKNEDGSVQMKDGKPVLKAKPNNARGPARKAILAWLAENAPAAAESAE